MALEDILRALDEQAAQECAEIVKVAEGQAAAIAQEAEREAEELTRERLAVAEETARQKAERTVSAARLEGMREISAVRQQTFESVFDAVQARLAAMRSTPAYESIFERLLREALDGVSGPCTLLVDPADADVARPQVARLAVDCAVDASLSTAGGLVVQTGGGRVMRRNTFESRLELARSSAQAPIAEILE